MEPANKPPVSPTRRRGRTEIEFLPDADAIERNPLPTWLRMTLHVLAGLFVAFILWANFSTVEQVVMAHGRLVNPTTNIVVQPLDTATILAINVRAGQVVKKGQVLATLDPTFTQADEDQLRTRLKSLDTQTEGLRAELAGKPGASLGTGGGSADQQLQAQLSVERQANFEAQKNKMEQNIARLKAGIETNQRDQQVLAQRLKSLSEIEAMQERLVAENFGAKMQLLEARDRRLEVERSLVVGRSRDLEMQRELAAAVAEQSAFSKNWRQKMMEDLLAATRDRDGINEQLTKADRRNKLVQLVAPADAVVLEVAKVSPGSVARGAETMFTLVPLGAKLEAEVQIDSLDSGHVKAGDLAHVKIDAFPYQKHGMLEGKLVNVSSDSFKREQVQAGQGVDAYYLGTVELGAVGLRKLDGTRMLPGMTLTAEIVVGKRSVMSYLLWPLTKALDESIREP
ncbi:HlyD family type I secretion periplasmic adaptor subunit [Pseudoduganella sp. LjRoot289]|uniref:HlyD family type I secretion periplasmic adaptor subunit n=1 Tax=Pseudoduganella sp. LjRoot289 TaxID=3342314 RepID=UPI003ECD3F37